MVYFGVEKDMEFLGTNWFWFFLGMIVFSISALANQLWALAIDSTFQENSTFQEKSDVYFRRTFYTFILAIIGGLCFVLTIIGATNASNCD